MFPVCLKVGKRRAGERTGVIANASTGASVGISGHNRRFLSRGTRVKTAASVVRGVLVLDRCPSSSPSTSWLSDRRIAGGGLVVGGPVLNLYGLQATGLTFRLIQRRLNGLGAGAATQYPT